MSCCGEAKSVGRQVRNIAVGYVSYKMGVRYEFTDDRIRACHKCDEQTWMGLAEYNRWLAANSIDVLKNFTQLEKLPKLPKYQQGPKRRRLYCRICKCFIPAKARVEEMKCPLDKWD